jgi:hypothetical protein
LAIGGSAIANLPPLIFGVRIDLHQPSGETGITGVGGLPIAHGKIS